MNWGNNGLVKSKEERLLDKKCEVLIGELEKIRTGVDIDTRKNDFERELSLVVEQKNELSNLLDNFASIKSQQKKFNDDADKQQNVIKFLIIEKNSLGAFGGKRKKEINAEIEAAEEVIRDLQLQAKKLEDKCLGYQSSDGVRKALDFVVGEIEDKTAMFNNFSALVTKEDVEKALQETPTGVAMLNDYNDRIKRNEENSKPPEFVVRAEEDKSRSVEDAKAKYKPLKSVKPGENIKFGAFFFNSRYDNEEIEWKVLAKKGKKLLVITDYAIDCKPFNKTENNITWERSTIRKWLNEDFYKYAFTFGERTMISEVVVSADKNSNYNTSPGFKTKDKIFLFSIPEVKRNLGRKGMAALPTPYAQEQGAYIDEDNGNCWWWLRAPGETQMDAAYIGVDGEIRYPGDKAYIGSGCIRPVLWIDLTKVD